MAKIDMRQLGLKPREMRVMRAAVWARGVTPNGHYLCASNEIASAKRLVERGFLTKPDRGGDVHFGNPDDWLVVCLTKENIAAITEVPIPSRFLQRGRRATCPNINNHRAK